MCHPQQTFSSVVLVVIVITASATFTVAQPAAAAANLSEDAQTLLQEQAWADAFLWNSSTRMCHDWMGVHCDAGDSYVTEL